MKTKEYAEYHRATIIAITRALVSALEQKHKYTQGHSLDVSEFSRRLAQTLGLDKVVVEWIRIGGLLHDVGKICIERNTLDNANPTLTVTQRLEVRDHPYIGSQIILNCGTPFPGEVIQAVLHHHERFSGGGYPLGLVGEAIPLPGRIVAIADTFNALTTHRSYQTKRSIGQAIAVLRTASGEHLDPRLVEISVEKVIPDLPTKA